MIFGRSEKRRIDSWDEQNLYTSWRSVLFWQPRERRKIKRRTHKWERRKAKNDLQKERDE